MKKKNLVISAFFYLLIHSQCWPDNFMIGLDAYKLGDYSKTLEEWIPLAKKGDKRAQYNLGFMYDKGEGVPQDYIKAIKWYTLASEQGLALAQYNLAMMYRKGEGVLQNYKKAFELYILSAEQGFTKSQADLGYMYLNGYGVNQNYIKAHMWSNIAASKKEKIALNNREIASMNMTIEQIEIAQNLATECVNNNYKNC